MKSKFSDPREKRGNKVVVDTSILISATLVDGAYRKLLRRLLEMDFELYIPYDVIQEYERIVQQPKFKPFEPLFYEIFEELRKSSIILPPVTKKRYRIRNAPEDEAIVNCCTENHITYLVTADKGTVGRYNGLEVMYATDFFAKFLSN